MKMNKTGFIKELSKKTGYDEEMCAKINEIVEDTFIIGKNNKEIMIEKFVENLNVNKEKANEIYDTVNSIIGNAIKEKLKNPFKK